MKMLDRKNVLVCFPVNVPEDVMSQGRESVFLWLRDYMYEMASSGDGSELLANMKISQNTTIFPEDARVIGGDLESVEVLVPVKGDHPTLVTINLSKEIAAFEGYD